MVGSGAKIRELQRLEKRSATEALLARQARQPNQFLATIQIGITLAGFLAEDLVEELVGEIYDETEPDLAAVVCKDDGTIVLPGRFTIHDLPDMGVSLPEGDYATVAGLVLEVLGRIPAAGDHATIDGWRLEVRAMRGRAVTEISLVPTGDEHHEQTGEPGAANGAGTVVVGVESRVSDR